ncbi:MAG: MBL fold metallo-hydrolase [bacterium]|nr:MBL fold metallo-hydrolase [bacterium]
MRVSPHVHTLWLEFEIEPPGGGKIPRFVTSYVIEGERLAVVDTGVAQSVPEIFACVESIGRKPEDIAWVVNTHSHFDHIGGNGVIAERAAPRFCAHPFARPLIEDLDLQNQIRPAGNMRQKMSGPVKIGKLLGEEDVLDLGGGVSLETLHTPGHSSGSLSLFVPGDGALICGDVLPEPDTLPIYENVPLTLESLEKLRQVRGANLLLSAMSRKVSKGPEVAAHIDAGEAYLRRIDRLVREAVEEMGEEENILAIGKRVFAALGLPEAGLIPIVLRSFQAHLECEPLEERGAGGSG